MTNKPSDPNTIAIAAIIEQFEPLINKLARSYLYKFPACSQYDIDDLKQECRMEISEAAEEFDPDRSSLMTFVYSRCKWKLSNLLVSQCREKRQRDETEDIDFNSLAGDDSPERNAMLMEFLEQCASISSEFANMIVNGADRDLLLEERRTRRARLRVTNGKRENLVNIPLKFSKHLIENFFHLDLKKIEATFYNTIE